MPRSPYRTASDRLMPKIATPNPGPPPLRHGPASIDPAVPLRSPPRVTAGRRPPESTVLTPAETAETHASGQTRQA